MAIVKHLSMIGLLCQAGSCDKTPEYQGADQLEDNIIHDSVASLGGSVPGLPGEDYPILAVPPETSFTCTDKVNGGYYADTEARCQAFHICAGETELLIFSFLCPNGTLFNQQYFVCDWWFNVDCDKTEQFYSLNDELDTARQEAAQSNYQEDIVKTGGQTNSQSNSLSDYSRSNVGRGSGLRRSLSQIVQEAEKDNFLFPDIDESSNKIDDSPVYKPAISLQTLYGAPGGSNRLGNNDVEGILSFEAEIPPVYKRPSRDLQFDYVNTAAAKVEASKSKVAKAAKEAEEEAQQLLETLVRLVSPDDLDQLYIR